MTVTAGYDGPNFTQVPNLLLEEHMRVMKEAELRVVLAIARKTFGWHKKSDILSLSQLMELTGLSRQGVINGLDDGIERGIITRKKSGQSYSYSLVVNEVDDLPTSQRSRPELVNEVDGLLVNEVDTQKKELLNKPKDKQLVANATSPKPTKPKRSEAATLLSLKNKELLKELEPDARPVWPAVEKQINALAAGDSPMSPDDYEFVFRELKRDPWWGGKAITPVIVGKQAGAILFKAKSRQTSQTKTGETDNAYARFAA